MRDYSRVSPQFWLGKTGKALRGDCNAQIVALYLVTGPHATMTGVFHCPVMYIAHETGLTFEGASKGLQRLIEEGFCSFDHDRELVWVHEMARFQIGAELKPNDKQVLAVRRAFQQIPECQIRRGFHARYRLAFHLPDIAEQAGEKQGSPKGDERGIEGPSKPLRSQEQEQEQEQEPKVDATASVDAGASPGLRVPMQKANGTPYQSILDAYHQHFPSGRQVSTLNDKRKRAIAARWSEVLRGDYRQAGAAKKPRTQEQAIQFFERYFSFCETLDWCSGRRPIEGKTWRGTIDNLVGADFMAKRSDEAYDNREAG